VREKGNGVFKSSGKDAPEIDEAEMQRAARELFEKQK
jgi:hypothetical protein